ncbi:ACT domain-containing protein ACR4-like protein isoform X1 [Tanacetum coccineum]
MIRGGCCPKVNGLAVIYVLRFAIQFCVSGSILSRSSTLWCTLLRVRFTSEVTTYKINLAACVEEMSQRVSETVYDALYIVLFARLVIQLKTMTVGTKQILCNVLEGCNKAREAKTVVLNGGTHTQRRLHQMMLEDRDFERNGCSVCYDSWVRILYQTCRLIPSDVEVLKTSHEALQSPRQST